MRGSRVGLELQLQCNTFSVDTAGGTMDRPPDAGREAPVGKATPRLSAAALFAGAREVIIEHGPEEYRLQITKHGKLILTK